MFSVLNRKQVYKIKEHNFINEFQKISHPEIKRNQQYTHRNNNNIYQNITKKQIKHAEDLQVAVTF